MFIDRFGIDADPNFAMGAVLSGPTETVAAQGLLTVTTLEDEAYDGGSETDEANDGQGLSLREALAIAATTGERITFDANLTGQTILLPLDALDITAADLVIDGDLDDDGVADITVLATGAVGRAIRAQAGVSSVEFDGVNVSVDTSGSGNRRPVAIEALADGADLFIDGEVTARGSSSGSLSDQATAIGVAANDVVIGIAQGAEVRSEGRFGIQVDLPPFDAGTGGPGTESFTGTTVNNDGLIEAPDDAIRLITGTVNNSGTIRTLGTFDNGGFISPGETADAVQSFGLSRQTQNGQDVDPGGTLFSVVNTSTGLIEGARTAIFTNEGGEVVNDGLITAKSAAIIVQSFREVFEDNVFTLVNTGTISTDGDSFGLGLGDSGGGVLINRGLAVSEIENSGTISSGAVGIAADSGTDFTNLATGELIAGLDGDLALPSDLAFLGIGVEQFFVGAALTFQSAPANSQLRFTDDNVSLSPDGLVITPVGVFPLPIQVPAATINLPSAPLVLPRIDFAATQNSGEITFQVNEFGDFVFPNTVEVQTDEAGIVNLQPLGSNQFAVSSSTFQPIIFIPEGENFDDTITNFGLIDGRIDTGVGDDTVIQSGTHIGITRLGQGDDTFDGTLSATFVDVEGGDGDDTIIGSAQDDFISGDAGADTMTGGDGNDVFLVFSGAPFEEDASDLITDFSVGDILQIETNGFVPPLTFEADADDPTQGTLTGFGVFDGPGIRFENLDPTKVFVVERDDPFDFSAAITLADGPVDGVFDLTLDSETESFGVINRLQTANVTITDEASLGNVDAIDFNTSATALRVIADTLNVDNAGAIDQAILGGETLTFTNSGAVGAFDEDGDAFFDNLGIRLIGDSNGADAQLTLNNTENGVLTGILGALFATVTDTESATLNNSGLIEATFALVQLSSSADTEIRNFSVVNSGTMRTVDPVFPFFSASLGLANNSTSTFTLDNSGLISVESALGGSIFGEAAAVITGQRTPDATITNSGTIQSTGVAIASGFIDDGDAVGVVRIINEASGRIVGDTNENGDGAAILAGTTILNLDTAEFETRTRFEIDNAGEMLGDVSLFAADDFRLTGGLTFVLNPETNFSTAAIGIQGLDGLVFQLVENGVPVFDAFGDPVFPETVEHPTFGTLTIVFSSVTGVELFGEDGLPIIVLPDAEDIEAGVFNDVFVNTGTIVGDVELGIGDDVFDTSAGSFTGSVDAGAGDDLVIGATTADQLFGGEGDDRLFALGGDDLLAGGRGDDFIDGSSGRDTVTYEFDVEFLGATQGIVMLGNTITDTFGDTDTLSRIEQVVGSELNDVFEIQDAAGVSVSAGGGDDFLRGGALTDFLSGDEGADFLAGGEGNDVLSGGDGDDRIFGEDGNDALNGGAGDDYVVGNGGDDSVAGGAGNDRLQGRDGNDRLFGEDGNDQLRGGAGDDRLVGNAGDDALFGEAGDDIVDGRSGNDIIVGGLGNDEIIGGSGFDTLDYSELGAGIEVDLIAGTITKVGVGSDTVTGVEVVIGTSATDVIFGSDLADELFGGDGFDVLVGEGGADLLNGQGGDDRLFGLDGNDELFGGEGDDYLVGNDGDDVLFGGDGNDNLQGREGNDFMFGEAGDDEFYGFQGDDFAEGGEGDDFLAGYEGDDTLVGGAGNDRFFGMDDDDTLSGGDGEDFLIGNAGNDLVFGDAGNDNLRGRDGADSLFGGDGNDFITGGAGSDLLSGDGGFDTLVGDAGADTFVFSGDWRRDTVSDWSDGEDVIDLSALGLKQAGESDADAFAKLTLVQDGSTAIISVTGDTRNDIRLSNTDVSTLDAADFLFGAAPAAPAASAVQSDGFDFASLPPSTIRREILNTDFAAVDVAAASAALPVHGGDQSHVDWAGAAEWQSFAMISEEEWGAG